MKKYSSEYVKNKINEVHNNKIEMIDDYITSKTKIKFKCNVCNYEWTTIPQVVMKGHGCPKCAKSIKKDIEIFKKEVYSLVGDEYTVIDKEYTSTHTKIKFRHNICGTEFYMEPNAFLRGQRCPNERYEKSSIKNRNKAKYSTIDNLKKLCEKDGYEILECNGKNAKYKIKLLCLNCNEIYEVSLHDFCISGSRCKCNTMSKGEKYIKEILDENKIEYAQQYTFDDCKNIRKLPFDFAIFENNKLKCLIEYDGSQHYYKKFSRSNEDFENLKKRDLIKTNYCEKNKIKLIRIKYIRKRNIEDFKNELYDILIKNNIV